MGRGVDVEARLVLFGLVVFKMEADGNVRVSNGLSFLLCGVCRVNRQLRHSTHTQTQGEGVSDSVFISGTY